MDYPGYLQYDYRSPTPEGGYRNTYQREHQEKAVYDAENAMTADQWGTFHRRITTTYDASVIVEFLWGEFFPYNAPPTIEAQCFSGDDLLGEYVHFGGAAHIITLNITRALKHPTMEKYQVRAYHVVHEVAHAITWQLTPPGEEDDHESHGPAFTAAFLKCLRAWGDAEACRHLLNRFKEYRASIAMEPPTHLEQKRSERWQKQNSTPSAPEASAPQ